MACKISEYCTVCGICISGEIACEFCLCILWCTTVLAKWLEQPTALQVRPYNIIVLLLENLSLESS